MKLKEWLIIYSFLLPILFTLAFLGRRNVKEGFVELEVDNRILYNGTLYEITSIKESFLMGYYIISVTSEDGVESSIPFRNKELADVLFNI
ncbi:hypothetical protein DAY19_14360 [Halobacteriovorax vibrionivorans]|uniref:Uncharacterized protein n=1 Tax=Halobacteriovorax vibrionivorans TaxID=2152716 RepID=A0ABY0IIJ0_9BACT|nr:MULTISPECIES: hypothetical protein [Halobacteriovorax]RZF21157.1 hypothetical protein DAY19_14360 [Halobacteriovorax vibrionivorans]TGD46247.1 hypothetical protein EP118_12660 [Halobacteriovorax sp. Y22]